MVTIPTELEISVSNTFSVAVRHTALLFESEIGQIISSVESENASCWSLKLLTMMKKEFLLKENSAVSFVVCRV